jgi:hypothetical protein
MGRIHTFMIFNPADLAAFRFQALPPDIPEMVGAHFFDGESIFTTQRRYKLKGRDLEGRSRILFMDASGI